MRKSYVFQSHKLTIVGSIAFLIGSIVFLHIPKYGFQKYLFSCLDIFIMLIVIKL